MSASNRRSPVGWLAVVLMTAAACNLSEPVPSGIPMAELRSQNRSPLEIVTFQSASGLGDAVLGMALDEAGKDSAEGDESVKVQPKRHTLTVTNISNCPITSFECRFSYVGPDDQPVTSTKATPKTNYLADPGDGIAPGATETLEVTLLIPENTTARPTISLVLYEEDRLKKFWKAPVPASK